MTTEKTSPVESAKNTAAAMKELEEQVLAMLGKLTSFARETKEYTATVPLPNAVLFVSPAEWRSLLTSFPEAEKSFRADLNHVLRRYLGVAGAIQEESAIYKVRSTSSFLWEKHRNNLVQLQNLAKAVLAELEKMREEARFRGLTLKTQELVETSAKLQRQIQEIEQIGPARSTLRMVGLGDDPMREESRIQSITNQLVSVAKQSAEPASSILLPQTTLLVSSTEWQALTTDFPENENSFRANLGRTVRRTLGTLATIQEEQALFEAGQGQKFHWKRHLASLFYLAHTGNELLPDLVAVAEEAQSRGLKEKASHLTDLVNRFRKSLEHISQLDHTWKEDGSSGDSTAIRVPERATSSVI